MNANPTSCMVGLSGLAFQPIDRREMLCAGPARGAASPAVRRDGERARPASFSSWEPTAIFDPDELLRYCFQSTEMAAEIIECFFDEVGNLFPQMQTALDKGDLAGIGWLGHRMKGTVMYLGARRATEAALQVEAICGSSHCTPSVAEDAVRVLQRECLLLRAAIQNHPLAAQWMPCGRLGSPVRTSVGLPVVQPSRLP